MDPSDCELDLARDAIALKRKLEKAKVERESKRARTADAEKRLQEVGAVKSELKTHFSRPPPLQIRTNRHIMRMHIHFTSPASPHTRTRTHKQVNTHTHTNTHTHMYTHAHKEEEEDHDS